MVLLDVVDVSSGVEFENQPSRIGKDEKRVEDFIKAVRSFFILIAHIIGMVLLLITSLSHPPCI